MIQHNQSSVKKTLTPFRILFWNARSIKKRQHDLPQLLQNVDIFICVESWIQGDEISIKYPSTFVHFMKNRQDSRGGGILLLIRKNYSIYRNREYKYS